VKNIPVNSVISTLSRTS